MSADTIPDDVMAVARSIAKDIGRNQPVYYAMGNEFEVADAENALTVARAILAERERCASVTERLIEERRGLSLSFAMIAAAIRNPTGE